MTAFTRAWQQAARRRRLAAYDAASTALFARMSSQPDATRKGLIDDLIVQLKADGIWAKLDALWLLAAHDSQAARLNWVSSAHGLAAVNAPAFTADRGYAGNGSTSYLDTNWNPAASSLFTLDSASLGCWVNVDAGIGNLVEMGCETGTARVRINNRSTTTLMIGRANQDTGTNFNGAPADRLGMSIVSRTASNAIAAYRKGSPVASGTTASGARPNSNMFLCGYNDDGALTSPTTARLAMAFAGAGLNSTEAAAFEAAVETFLTAIGGN